MISDPFQILFLIAFVVSFLASSIYAIGSSNKTQIIAAFTHAACAIMVVLADNFLSLFMFYELMTVGSAVLIFSSPYKSSQSAGIRYVIIHCLAGVIMLSGIALYYGTHHHLGLHHLHIDADLQQSLPAILILSGILINAGAYPCSFWVADSYPESSVAGTVFLSTYTTKTSVFVLIKLFAGTHLLIYVGLIMIFYGIIYAILENDIRRILCYSIVNQVGFMVTAIGIGTDLALAGAAIHAFCHIFYKSLLLMAAGAVMLMTGKRTCLELGGLYKSMKLTTICGIIGALSISAFPCTSGFISKSLILEAAHGLELHYVYLLLTAASAGVFLHAGIKFPWFVFFQQDSGLRVTDPPRPMRIAMILLAILCILPGIYPQVLYQLFPGIDYQPYSYQHVMSQLELLAFSALAFFGCLPYLKRTKTITLDLDWIFRHKLYPVLIFKSFNIKNILVMPALPRVNEFACTSLASLLLLAACLILAII